MKKTILTIITAMLLTFILTTLLITYTLKITNIENGNITINILGQEQTYYFEK